MFLPESHKQRFGISFDVERVHRELSGKFTIQECINQVIEGCEKLPTMRGVFFEVAEPKKSEILKFIPRNKMEGRWFGISQGGIFSINKETEAVSLLLFCKLQLIMPIWVVVTITYCICMSFRSTSSVICQKFNSGHSQRTASSW